jgi:hypothetical protein
MSAKLHPVKHDLKTVQWCGPTALAAISGQPTSVVHAAIKQCARHIKHVKGVSYGLLQNAGAALGYRLQYRDAANWGNAKRTWPTLAQWLRANKAIYAQTPVIVCVTGHYVTVCGRSFIDNHTKTTVPLSKAPGRRCRVKAFFVVSPLTTPVPPVVVPPKAIDVHRVVRQEAKALAAKHEIRIEGHNPGEFWVYPPHGLYHAEEADPYDDNHLAFGWPDVLKRVKEYAADALQVAEDNAAVPASVVQRFASQIPFEVGGVRCAGKPPPTPRVLANYTDAVALPPAPSRPAPAPSAVPASLPYSIDPGTPRPLSPARPFPERFCVLTRGRHYTDGERVGIFTSICAVTEHSVELVVSLQDGVPVKETFAVGTIQLVD